MLMLRKNLNKKLWEKVTKQWGKSQNVGKISQNVEELPTQR
jgi:hypothetical protein